MLLSKNSKLPNDPQKGKDFQKLMDICNSYGLNEQETCELISDFKKGALFTPEHSFNDSLNQNQLQSFRQKQQEEQYSFKHQRELCPSPHAHQESGSNVQEDYAEQSNCSNRQINQNQLAFQALEKILSQKFTIQKDFVTGLQKENDNLRQSMAKKEQKIDNLLQMKKQDTDIIMGLKDIIANMTQTLKLKQESFQNLQQKYTDLMESKVRQLSNKQSTIDASEIQIQDITNTNHLNKKERQMNKQQKAQLGMKQRKQLKESRDRQNKDSRDTVLNDMKKVRGSNKIDVKKYKEMIQNLRNNY